MTSDRPARLTDDEVRAGNVADLAHFQAARLAELERALEAERAVRHQVTAALQRSPHLGCLCQWDQDGNPIGEHGPLCGGGPERRDALTASIALDMNLEVRHDQ